MVEPVRDFADPLLTQSSRGYATPARRCDDVGESEAAGLPSVRSVTDEDVFWLDIAVNGASVMGIL